MTTKVEIDDLVGVVKSAIPDMETYELTDLETAINAELQIRYQSRSRPETFCDCEACQILRGSANAF